ncbi:MAG: putative glycosyltransferase [Catillopecten margaritatus gill symbiont]|uniref:Glycosyltransferase n=1 Tax=Catillopecten margaritatus gill symbiont TaxID=3083288 RepID=A0AAU6PG10_9GAMM
MSITTSPLISIVTIVFNGVEFLEETIQSVVSQTHENIEYIVIDGGSTDGTVEIIKKYEDKISRWISEPDKGIYDAMNKGIDLATGDWINFMNSGDCFLDKSVVDKVIPALGDDMIVVYGDTILDYGTYTSLKPSLDLSKMYYGQVIGHQSSFVNTTYHKKNLFSLEYKIAGDYDFLLRAYINNKNKVKRIPVVVSIFAMDGVSSSNEVKSTLERIKILKNIRQYKLQIRFAYFLLLLKIMIKRKLPLNTIKRLNKRKG